MNEIQIIQQHLAIERQHFAQVVAACTTALAAPRAAHEPLIEACAQYFEFAVTRLQPDAIAAARARLQAARKADPDRLSEHWQAFLQMFTAACNERFATIDELAKRNESVAQWRNIGRLDAESIVGERERFARVQAGLSGAP
ncbi:MAG TPA: hypothetical protein VFB37_05050 [Steroidobacteraceae bacterium]|nr:hypothetical protein [Steroidobacteraceae bacterium]